MVGKSSLFCGTKLIHSFSAIYGGFARSCVAKTMEDNIENEYIVTDEDGCATDSSIFGEWDYSPETNSLLASFNAFKFPSSDNIRFQCNIRVCFGRCQPVNCRGSNAFGKRRRRREIGDSNETSVGLPKSENPLLDGQLREEITISSNAILTLEKKEDRLSDGSDSKFFVLTIKEEKGSEIKNVFFFLFISSSGRTTS